MDVADIQKLIRDAVVEALDRAVADAYRAGFEAGHEEAARQVYAAVAAALPATAGLAPVPVSTAAQAVDQTSVDTVSNNGADAADQPEALPAAKRAPRGLTTKVVTNILSAGFALPMEEVQRRAVAADSRIQPKTVYNELYRGNERGKAYFRDRNARWRLRRPEDDDEQPRLVDAPSERETTEAPIAMH